MSNRHMLRRSDGLLARAAAVLQRTVAANPHDTAALLRLGDVYRGLGQLREALECYQRVVALRPDDPKARSIAAILGGEVPPDGPPGAGPYPFVRMVDFLPAVQRRAMLALASRARFESPRGAYSDRLVDSSVRKCLVADPRIIERQVRPWFEARLRSAFADALPRLRLREPSKYWIEMSMTACPDGGFFAKHTDETNFRGRKASFAYYFHREPRRFSGGDLLLHDGDGTPAFTRIEPRHNSIVLFPSTCVHEIVAVDSDSMDFGDSRFAIHGSLRTDFGGEQ